MKLVVDSLKERMESCLLEGSGYLYKYWFDLNISST